MKPQIRGIGRVLEPDTAICAALWPDSPPERAAANLRSTLWRINRNHPPLLRVAAGALALHAEVEVDAHLLARSAHTHRPASR